MEENDTRGTTSGEVASVDFDYRTDQALWAAPWARWDQLGREHRLFRTDTGPDRIWVATCYEDVHRILRDYTTFSTRSVAPWDPVGAHTYIPLELDPPLLAPYRQMLTPWFKPGEVAALEPKLRAWAGELVDQGGCELMADFANQLPTRIFLDQMGLPFADLDMLLEWEADFLHADFVADPSGAQRDRAVENIRAYLAAALAERRTSLGDDLMSSLITTEIGGETMSEDDQLNAAFFLFSAGLDTVAAQLGPIFWHLATHDEDRRRVAEHPEDIPAAVEEFLRLYSVASPGRFVEHDVEVGGCPVSKGDRVLASIVAANRDAGAFERADEFVLDRADNAHLAFAVGPHRCLGSHLARAELRIALEEWHARIPSYRLDPDTTPVSHGGPNVGFTRLPLVW